MPPRNNRSPEIATRLTLEDYERVSKFVTARNTTAANLLREAVIDYINRQEAGDTSELEAAYAAQLRASTNRICALLAKVAIDARTIYQVFKLNDDAEPLLREARSIAVRQITEKLAGDELDVAKQLKRAIGS